MSLRFLIAALFLVSPLSAFSANEGAFDPGPEGCPRGSVMIVHAVIQGVPVSKCVPVECRKVLCLSPPAGCAYADDAPLKNGCPEDCGSVVCPK